MNRATIFWFVCCALAYYSILWLRAQIGVTP